MRTMEWIGNANGMEWNEMKWNEMGMERNAMTRIACDEENAQRYTKACVYVHVLYARVTQYITIKISIIITIIMITTTIIIIIITAPVCIHIYDIYVISSINVFVIAYDRPQCPSNTK